MRHSFLPTSEQKALKKKYRIHATVVALFLLSVIGVIGIGALFPAYIEVSFEEKGQAAMLNDATSNQANQNSLDMTYELRADAALAQELSGSSLKKRPSDLIAEIISARASVKISSIAISSISSSTAVMVVQGIAPTREALVSYKNRLEGLTIGNKVELPISELAKSKDIRFSLRFTRTLP